MKSILLSLCGILLFSSASSFADSVQTLTNLDASFFIEPNNGTGENLFGTITGSGVNLSVAGTSPAGWFTSGVGIAPGAYVGGSIPIHVDSILGFLQGSQPNLSMESADFNAGVFALPTNGQNEFQTVPATLNLMFTACLQNVCTTYDLNIAGRLGLYYLFNPIQRSVLRFPRRVRHVCYHGRS